MSRRGRLSAVVRAGTGRRTANCRRARRGRGWGMGSTEGRAGLTDVYGRTRPSAEGGSYGLPTAWSADGPGWPSGCVGGVKTAQTDSPICVRFRAIAQYALDRHSMAGRPPAPVEAAAYVRPYRAGRSGWLCFRGGCSQSRRTGTWDSTGSIAGNLLGVIHGRSGIPVDWAAGLKPRDVFERVGQDPWAHFGPEARGPCDDLQEYPSRKARNTDQGRAT